MPESGLVIALTCPKCNKALQGLTNDIVFFCPECRTAWELVSGVFVPHPLVWALPLKNLGVPHFHLPFWHFRMDYHLVGEYSERFKTLSAVPKIGEAWVPAFFQRDILYYGDLGYHYTLAKFAYQGHDRGDYLWAASRDLTTASVYLRLFILKILDQSVDIGGWDVNPMVEAVELVNIPFYHQDNKLVEGMLGMALPCAVLDDWEEIRAILRRGRQEPAAG